MCVMVGLCDLIFSMIENRDWISISTRLSGGGTFARENARIVRRTAGRGQRQRVVD
jgi:hypothetical protein